MIQARKALEDEKMTQAKILELRMEFLVDAISKCHMAVATRKRWKEIQASMDAVEIAWDRIKLTSLEFGSHDLNLDHLPMMVEMVLRKATKYLAKAQAKMEKWWEAQVQALEAEKASEQPRKTSYEMPCDDEDRGKELNAKVNEVASEVSAVNEVAPEVSAANKENEVNANKENEVNVNEESSVNEDDRVVCNFKEVAPEVSNLMIKEVELHIAHKAQVEIIAEALEEQNGAKVKFDVNVEAKVEVFGMKEVKNWKDDNKVEMFDSTRAKSFPCVNPIFASERTTRSR